MTPTESKLRAAAVQAYKAGRPINSLMELESFGGPACGAAGSIVRKWPDEGVVEGELRLVYQRNGKRSEIHVFERIK